MPYYLVHSIVSWVHSKHERIHNLFGYETMKISVQDGAKNNAAKLYKFYISYKKDFSKRYSTDCLSDMLTVRALRATWGLNDEPTYKNERASFVELPLQNSYFVRDVMQQLRDPASIQDPVPEKKILFLYVDGSEINFCEGSFVSDLYSYFSTAVGAMNNEDLCAVFQRLSKYSLKTDPFLEFRQWLSDSFMKGRIDPDRFSLLNEQVDYIQSRCPQR